jgi:hypothetical protein
MRATRAGEAEVSHKDGRVVLSAWVEPALRDYAREAARRSGLEFSRWVERTVRQTMARESADRALADALADARERGECSSCEKLRALSRSCEYVVKATEAGDVSELWAVRFDVMGRPYNSRIGVTSHGVAALVAAAVNALPELLDAVESSRLKAEMYERDWYEAKSEFGSAMAGMSARIRNAEQALATAEAERLTLARALRTGNGHLDQAASELAARIVAEADAEVRRG